MAPANGTSVAPLMKTSQPLSGALVSPGEEPAAIGAPLARET